MLQKLCENTTNRFIKVPIEMLTTPSKTVLNMCFKAERFKNMTDSHCAMYALMFSSPFDSEMQISSGCRQMLE